MWGVGRRGWGSEPRRLRSLCSECNYKDLRLSRVFPTPGRISLGTECVKRQSTFGDFFLHKEKTFQKKGEKIEVL